MRPPTPQESQEAQRDWNRRQANGLLSMHGPPYCSVGAKYPVTLSEWLWAESLWERNYEASLHMVPWAAGWSPWRKEV